jgi:hypothetical protein
VGFGGGGSVLTFWTSPLGETQKEVGK